MIILFFKVKSDLYCCSLGIKPLHPVRSCTFVLPAGSDLHLVMCKSKRVPDLHSSTEIYLFFHCIILRLHELFHSDEEEIFAHLSIPHGS